MKRILLPIASESPTPKALDMAKTIAGGFDAEIILLHVISDFRRDLSIYTMEHVHASELAEQHVAQAKMYLRRIAGEFSGMDILVTEDITQGNVAQEILRYSEEKSCDMIIMSAHDKSEASPFNLGSITYRVVHHSKIPVMVVR